MHGKILRKAAIRLKGLYPGREVEGTLPTRDGAFRQRIYVSGGNVYWQIVVGVPFWTTSADANKFLDSFKIGSRL